MNDLKILLENYNSLDNGEQVETVVLMSRGKD